jgi:hypothetical protein
MNLKQVYSARSWALYRCEILRTLSSSREGMLYDDICQRCYRHEEEHPRQRCLLRSGKFLKRALR